MTAHSQHVHCFRIGFGTDVHCLAPGSGFPLGGVRIPCDRAAIAVSDGDVLVHALVDAILGAIGMGDIGDHFPPSAVEPGQDSATMLAFAMGLAKEKGAVLVNADCVIDLEAVKLEKWKPLIRQSIADLLELEAGNVNVKAKTAEGLGPIGAGEAIAAQAIVLMAFLEGRKP